MTGPPRCIPSLVTLNHHCYCTHYPLSLAPIILFSSQLKDISRLAHLPAAPFSESQTIAHNSLRNSLNT